MTACRIPSKLAASRLEEENRPRVSLNTLFCLPRGLWIVVVIWSRRLSTESVHLEKANTLSSVGKCRHSAQVTTSLVSDTSAAFLFCDDDLQANCPAQKASGPMQSSDFKLQAPPDGKKQI